jgi:hypothetical protein
MANHYGPSPSPPWKYSPVFGDFVYKPSTDQIMTRNEQLQPRPPNISAASLSHAIWEGFQYTGPPRTFNSGYVSRPGFHPPVGGLQASHGKIPQDQSSQPYTFPGGAGQPSNLSIQAVTQGLRNYSLAPRTQGNDIQSTEFERNGQLLRHTFDPRTSVATLSVAPGQATHQSSRSQANVSRKSRRGKSEVGHIEFPGYKVHSASFFVVGRVFLVLWAEPAGGGGGTIVSKYELVNQLGQRVYSKARRFVVVREGAQRCHALPITTYGGRGVAKPRVVKADHAIIYTGEVVPSPSPEEAPGPGEVPMRSFPIRVNWDNPSEKLDTMSRINFGGVTVVQHNVMTKNCGMVNKNSLTALKLQFSNVFNQQPEAAEPSSDREQAQINKQRAGATLRTVMLGATGLAANVGNDGENEDEEDQGQEKQDHDDNKNDEKGKEEDCENVYEDEESDEDEYEDEESNEDEDEYEEDAVDKVVALEQRQEVEGEDNGLEKHSGGRDLSNIRQFDNASREPVIAESSLVESKDRDGHTPFDCALEEEQATMVEMLQEEMDGGEPPLGQSKEETKPPSQPHPLCTNQNDFDVLYKGVAQNSPILPNYPVNGSPKSESHRLSSKSSDNSSSMPDDLLPAVLKASVGVSLQQDLTSATSWTNRVHSTSKQSVVGGYDRMTVVSDTDDPALLFSDQVTKQQIASKIASELLESMRSYQTERINGSHGCTQVTEELLKWFSMILRGEAVDSIEIRTCAFVRQQRK